MAVRVGDGTAERWGEGTGAGPKEWKVAEEGVVGVPPREPVGVGARPRPIGMPPSRE